MQLNKNQVNSQEGENESIRPSMNSDQPAKKDSLGFGPYVEALASPRSWSSLKKCLRKKMKSRFH